MANQELTGYEFPVPVPEKRCKYCHHTHPELEWDEGMEAYFHKECLKKNIDMEIKEAILKSKVSFDDLKQPTRGKY